MIPCLPTSNIAAKALAAMILLAGWCLAGEGLWSAGLKTQGTVDFEPGQDFLSGPEAAYSDYGLFGHRLQFKLAYLTSRLEQVFRPNIIKQDYFLLSPAWHFRRKAVFDPLLQLDLGYMRYDVENERIFGDYLDNDSWIAAAQAGLNVNMFQGRFGFLYHVGYNLIIPESSLVFPGIFGLGIWMML